MYATLQLIQKKLCILLNYGITKLTKSNHNLLNIINSPDSTIHFLLSNNITISLITRYFTVYNPQIKETIATQIIYLQNQNAITPISNSTTQIKYFTEIMKQTTEPQIKNHTPGPLIRNPSLLPRH